MQKLHTEESDSEVRQQELELAQHELKAALVFAKFSSNSYSMGNLQHAIDAHSKATAYRARAARRLATSETTDLGAASVKSIMREVEDALSQLPGPFDCKVRAHGAAASAA